MLNQPQAALARSFGAAARPDAATVVARSGQLDALVALAELGTRVSFARNQEIWSEGDAARYLYKVVSGTVRTCKLLSDGRRHIATFYGPGDLFGLEAGAAHGFSAEAVDQVVLMRYARSGIERTAETNQALARHLHNLAFESLAEAHARMLLLGRKTANERVASFLLEQSERAGDADVIELAMSRNDVADYLGLTVETVSRELSTLKRTGIVAVPTAQRIEILDRDGLEAINGDF